MIVRNFLFFADVCLNYSIATSNCQVEKNELGQYDLFIPMLDRIHDGSITGVNDA